MSEDAEGLRRRLYRRDASDADVAAYTALRPPVEDPQRAVPARRRGPRGLLPPLVALAGAAAALLLAGRPAAAPPRPVALDVQRAAFVASTTERERDGFVAALGGSGPVGLLRWSHEHGYRAATAMEHRGRGRETLRLDLPRPTGRVEVLLVARSTASTSWRLLRAGDDGAAVDVRSLVSLPGDVAHGAVAYTAADRPVRLVVTAPADVRWDVAVLGAPTHDAQRMQG